MEAHENIEMAFENSITDKTRALFEEERSKGQKLEEVVFSLTAGYFGATILKKVISGGRRGRDIQVWNIIR